MLFNENIRRSLRGHLYHNIIGAKMIFYIVAAFISIAIIVNSLLVMILSLAGVSGNSYIDSLSLGLLASTVLLIIISINAVWGKTLNSSFTFPVNRIIYCIGNFISLLFITFNLLLIISVGQVFELLISGIIARTFNNMVMINMITMEAYLKGFFITFSYLVAIASLVYCIAAFCFRFKLPAVIALSAVIGIAFIFGMSRNAMYQAMMYFIGEQSMAALGLKLWLASMILQLLAYIPFRKAEVNP